MLIRNSGINCLKLGDLWVRINQEILKLFIGSGIRKLMFQTYIIYVLLDPHVPNGDMSDDGITHTYGMYRSLGHHDAADNHVD